MKLSLFLQKIENPTFLDSYKRMCFVVADTYPFLFFSMIIQKIKTVTQGTVEYLDLQEHEQESILSKLEMQGFLGTKNSYWLGNVSSLKAKKKKFWVDYIAKYQGQHNLCFCCDESDSDFLDKKDLKITLEAGIDRVQFEKIASIFESINNVLLKKLANKLFLYNRSVELDKACLLIHYVKVLGNNLDQFCNEWLGILCNHEQSLFKLSEYFLSKRSKHFFSLWSKVGHRYPEVFWVSYWSDTIWRAYHYVKTMRTGDFAAGKKMGYRLPFAFLKYDWKKVNTAELKAGHQFLYGVDHNIKNGVGAYGLELLYMNYMLGKFHKST